MRRRWNIALTRYDPGPARSSRAEPSRSCTSAIILDPHSDGHGQGLVICDGGGRAAGAPRRGGHRRRQLAPHRKRAPELTTSRSMPTLAPGFASRLFSTTYPRIPSIWRETQTAQSAIFLHIFFNSKQQLTNANVSSLIKIINKRTSIFIEKICLRHIYHICFYICHVHTQNRL